MKYKLEYSYMKKTCDALRFVSIYIKKWKEGSMPRMSAVLGIMNSKQTMFWVQNLLVFVVHIYFLNSVFYLLAL